MSYAEHSAEGIAILLWATHLAQPEKLATPFFHAAAAAAMDVPVEVYFTAASVRRIPSDSSWNTPTVSPRCSRS